MRAIVLGLVLLMGCAGRAAAVHLRTAADVRDALDAAAGSIEAVCTVEALETAEEPERWRDRCVRAAESQHLAVEAWETWVALAASEGLDASSVVLAASQLVAVYGQLADTLSAFGRDIPTLEL
jgi:hypothetical protein